ncbi:MAG: hydantoinase/oxoprolinase family protein, partial [Bacilli bacterium]
LMYEKVTEGIFFEIGGTSIDISVIKDGKVTIKNAQVGGNKTYLKSLDVRTLAIAGGSMIRISNNKIIDVGPRSAHLAHKQYECFASATDMVQPKVELITPIKGDPSDYAIVNCSNGNQYAYTLAGAANILGYVPAGDYAYSNSPANKAAWEALANYCQSTVEDVAKEVIHIACEKVWKVVEPMIEEYELDRSFVTLVGGGGSAAVLTPALGEKYSVNHRIAENAPYISTIGVAMAMIREQIERSIVNPSSADIQQIRHDVIHKIMESGAKEETIEVSIEVDKQKNILIATATGATEFKQQEENVNCDEAAVKEIVAQSISAPKASLVENGKAGRFRVYEGVQHYKKMFGLLDAKRTVHAVVDNDGVVHIRRANAKSIVTTKGNLGTDLDPLVDEMSTYSDAGQSIPKVYMFTGSKINDYSGLLTLDQLKPVVNMDFEYIAPQQEIIVLAVKK